MSVMDEMVAANRAFQAAFPYGGMAARPSRAVAVLTCMDARIDVYAALGLRPGEAHIVRNAGGRVADALRSLVVSSHVLGVREIAVIQHTRCGMLGTSNEALRESLAADLGTAAGAAAALMDFLPIMDQKASVREDVDLLRESPLIPAGVTVRGFVYEVETGALREVL